MNAYERFLQGLEADDETMKEFWNGIAKVVRAVTWQTMLTCFFISAAFTVTCVIEPAVPIVATLAAYRAWEKSREERD